jgi:hypothetical protein
MRCFVLDLRGNEGSHHSMRWHFCWERLNMKAVGVSDYLFYIDIKK